MAKKACALIAVLIFIFSVGFWAGAALRVPKKSPPQKALEAVSCPECHSLLPQADWFTPCPGSLKILAAYQNFKTPDKKFLGYVFHSTDIVQDSLGYSGSLKLLIALNESGEIMGVSWLEQSETPSYVARLDAYLKQFSGKAPGQPLVLGKDLDGITGATKTSEAIARIVRESRDRVMQALKGAAVSSAAPNPGQTSAADAFKTKLQAAGLAPAEAKYWKETDQ